jgi:hypothetical protein
MDIPEIRLCVGRYLDNHDLASCVLVNKLWYDTFLPFLYYSCDTGISYHARYWTSFKNYLQYTRNLNVSYNTLKTRKDQDVVLQKCTNLRQLSLNPAHLNTKFFLQIIQQNPRIKRLDLSVGEVTQMYTTDPITIAPSFSAGNFMNTVARSCPQLTELGLDMMLHPESEKQFYDTFSKNFTQNLTKLDWSWYRLNPVNISPWMTQENHNTICGASFPKLKELNVYISVLDIPHPWDQELVLFENSPSLEVLDWSWDPSPLFGPGNTDRTHDIQSFIKTLCRFIATRWLKLHSITLSMTRSDTYVFEDEQISRVLKCFRNPIRRLSLRNGNPCTKLTWQALRIHLNTIESLYISSKTGMTLCSSEIQEVLSSSPRLIDFQHDSVLDIMDVTKDMIQWPRCISSEFHYPWICHRLQVLKINLLRHPYDHLMNFAVFSQLTKLTELQVMLLTSPGRGREYGLDPTAYLYDLNLAESSPFDGQYSSYNEIRSHPVGKRLLSIWPGLINCYWYNL